jgi:hypothetical protein
MHVGNGWKSLFIFTRSGLPRAVRCRAWCGRSLLRQRQRRLRQPGTGTGFCDSSALRWAFPLLPRPTASTIITVFVGYRHQKTNDEQLRAALPRSRTAGPSSLQTPTPTPTQTQTHRELYPPRGTSCPSNSPHRHHTPKSARPHPHLLKSPHTL